MARSGTGPTPARGGTYSSPWLFAGVLAALSALAWWVLSRAPAPIPAPEPATREVFVPVYDPARGQAVARWRADWPAGVPVPTTDAVMRQALDAAIADERSWNGASAPPETPPDDAVAPQAPPSLASLRRACVEASRRGRDPARACDRFADASRPTLPVPVVRPSRFPSSPAPPAARRDPAAREEESLIHHFMTADNCGAYTRGSIDGRACRVHYREYLADECRARTQAQGAVAASPSDYQRLETRALCNASRRYQPLDN